MSDDTNTLIAQTSYHASMSVHSLARLSHVARLADDLSAQQDLRLQIDAPVCRLQPELEAST